MEPVSLTLAVVAAFKDVYLVGKFIHKTACSVKSYFGEQDILHAKFKLELLHLRSFGRLLTRNDGNVIDDELLNIEWLESVKFILDRLRETFADYSKIAAERDDDYKKYSPYSSQAIDYSNSEFPLDIEDFEPDSAEPELEKKKGISKFLARVLPDSKTHADSSKGRKSVPLSSSLRWALFDKDKLGGILQTFKEWNGELKQLVPYLLSINNGRYLKNQQQAQRLMEDDGGVNIFEVHLKLRQIVQDPDAEAKAPDTKEVQDILAANTKKSRVLVEYKPYQYPPDPESEPVSPSGDAGPGSELYARQLANLLKTVGSYNFHTLPFEGYVEDRAKLSYAFIFNYPPNTADELPKTLYSLITNKDNKGRPFLPLRFHIARTISQAIGAFHSDGWVHKSIRSQAVKFFLKHEREEWDLENPYLTDFEFSRPEASATRLLERTPDLDTDLYQHPERTGPPTASYNRVHDIYSLGVILLEIGLWKTAKDIYTNYYKAVLKRDSRAPRPTATIFQKVLQSEAEKGLGHSMGAAYKEAVISCISDEFEKYRGQGDFAMTFQKLVVQKVDVKKLWSMTE
ncbi:hypothetical protein ABW20_dc0105087 [Dactylellina cionopaga]|nr:hypothetical protein ABW20_dc0105087 [Dactylellina cionopaga]